MPKVPDHTVRMTIFLWTVELEESCKSVVREMYKAITNLTVRLSHEHQVHRPLVLTVLSIQAFNCHGCRTSRKSDTVVYALAALAAPFDRVYFLMPLGTPRYHIFVSRDLSLRIHLLLAHLVRSTHFLLVQ